MMQRVIVSESELPKDKRGGKRAGAGRKKTGKCHDAPHRRRPDLSPLHPVHVVLRSHMDWLRTGEMYVAIRRVLPYFYNRADFRICHLSIQKNHIHFLVEAASREALSKGMQSLATRCAHSINATYERPRRAKVFTFRYHATQITKPRQARNCLAYVLNNWRKHRADWSCERASRAKVDPYSSGVSFDGWAGQNAFVCPDGYVPLLVSKPHTALLTTDWKRFGYIGLFEIPGPLR